MKIIFIYFSATTELWKLNSTRKKKKKNESGEDKIKRISVKTFQHFFFVYQLIRTFCVHFIP